MERWKVTENNDNTAKIQSKVHRPIAGLSSDITRSCDGETFLMIVPIEENESVSRQILKDPS